MYPSPAWVVGPVSHRLYLLTASAPPEVILSVSSLFLAVSLALSLSGWRAVVAWPMLWRRIGSATEPAGHEGVCGGGSGVPAMAEDLAGVRAPAVPDRPKRPQQLASRYPAPMRATGP